MNLELPFLMQAGHLARVRRDWSGIHARAETGSQPDRKHSRFGFNDSCDPPPADSNDCGKKHESGSWTRSTKSTKVCARLSRVTSFCGRGDSFQHKVIVKCLTLPLLSPHDTTRKLPKRTFYGTGWFRITLHVAHLLVYIHTYTSTVIIYLCM
jgi:hypothetical protein